jgi:hypothetical protein
MKKKIQRALVLLIIIIQIVACSKDDETSTSNIPIVTTETISSITTNSAVSGGIISSEGGSAIISRGICWSTTTNPTIALSTKTNDGTGIGSFISSISGLVSNTTYYVRAYATNSSGTAYGNEVIFDTSSILLKKIVKTSGVDIITDEEYTYQGNKILTRTADGLYRIYKYTYTGNLITKIERFHGSLDNLFEITEYYYSGNDIIQSKRYDGDGILANIEDIVDNSDNTKNVTSTSYDNNLPTSVITYKLYFLNGEINKLVLFSDDGSGSIEETTTFFYDNKNNPMKNVTGLNSFIGIISIGKSHNLIKELHSGNIGPDYTEEYLYEYNSDGYPTTRNQVGDSTASYQFIY